MPQERISSKPEDGLMLGKIFEEDPDFEALCREFPARETSNVLPMIEGHDSTRKSEILMNRIQSIIAEDEFGDMTIAEVIGTLEIVKALHLHRLMVHEE